MRTSRLIASALVVLTPITALSAQSAPRLDVRGDGIVSRTLGAADLARLPHRDVRVKGHHDSTSTTYSGVLLSDVLHMVAPSLDSLRGREKPSTYVMVEAADNYGVVFALAELDPSLTDKVVLLADRMDGKPLPDAVGPLRLVVPDEKREARWVRLVRTVIVKRAVATP